MTRWRIWEYQLPLHNVLPASGEDTAIRSGYLIQRQKDAQISYTEIAPLRLFHGISKADCLQEFLDYIQSPHTESHRHSVTQLAIDILDAPKAPSRPIPVNALVDLRKCPPSDALSTLKCIKIKMGRRSLDTEISELQDLLRILPKNIQIRIDANRSWNMEELSECAAVIPPEQLDYFEEPLQSPEGYSSCPHIPIALDESMQLEYYQDIITLPNVKAAVLKPSVLGGLHATRLLIQKLESQNIAAIISSTFESSLTLWAISALAKPKYTHGLGTLSWFQQPLFKDPLSFDGQHLYPKPSAPQKPNASFLTELDR